MQGVQRDRQFTLFSMLNAPFGTQVTVSAAAWPNDDNNSKKGKQDNRKYFLLDRLIGRKRHWRGRRRCDEADGSGGHAERRQHQPANSHWLLTDVYQTIVQLAI